MQKAHRMPRKLNLSVSLAHSLKSSQSRLQIFEFTRVHRMVCYKRLSGLAGNSCAPRLEAKIKCRKNAHCQMKYSGEGHHLEWGKVAIRKGVRPLTMGSSMKAEEGTSASIIAHYRSDRVFLHRALAILLRMRVCTTMVIMASQNDSRRQFVDKIVRGVDGKLILLQNKALLAPPVLWVVYASSRLV